MGRIEDLRRLLDVDLPRLASLHDVPGVSVAVLVDGHVVEGTAGVVNLRTAVPVRPDSPFMIQSITKAWTATLVMQLVDEHLVELDVPVRTYLPTFRTDEEHTSGQITVRHLLTHTGGFEGDLWAPTTAGDDALQRFVEDLLPQASQHSPPGEMYSYCSAGYGVLGRLVEVQRGTTWAEALRAHLTDPLGIEELAFSADEALAFRTAIGHVRPSAGGAQTPLRTWAVLPPSNPAAGNQLAMSARSLIAFARLHLSDGRAPDGTRLLSGASARAMRERYVDHPAGLGASAGQGMGWTLPARPGLVEHGGDMIGVSAMLRMAPREGVAVAMLTNGGSGGRLMEDVLGPIFHRLAGLSPQARPTPVPDVGIPEPGRYPGRYRNRQSRYDVTLGEHGRLWLTESACHEALTMAHVAGIAVEPTRHELRWISGHTFARLDRSRVTVGAVEFVGRDALDRPRLLHTGRAAPRSSWSRADVPTGTGRR